MALLSHWHHTVFVDALQKVLVGVAEQIDPGLLLVTQTSSCRLLSTLWLCKVGGFGSHFNKLLAYYLWLLVSCSIEMIAVPFVAHLRYR